MMQNVLRLVVLTLSLGLGFASMAVANADQDFRDAIIAARGGDMDKAIVSFTRIIDAKADGIEKNLASAYNLRGVCYEAKEELQKALDDYTKAIELDAKLAEALGNRAFLYVKLGDTFKAKNDAIAAKRIDRKVKVPALD